MIAVAWILFLPISVALTIIDIRTHQLPNRFVGIALAVGAIAFATSGNWSRYAIAWLSALCLFLAYLSAHFLSRGGLGLGDVKLALVIGLYLGYLHWPLVFTSTWISFLAAGAVISVGLLSRRITLHSRIPFGPFLLLGCWGALVTHVANPT